MTAKRATTLAAGEAAKGKTVDSGVVTADKRGHVTLKQITVGKARNRVVISAAK